MNVRLVLDRCHMGILVGILVGVIWVYDGCMGVLVIPDGVLYTKSGRNFHVSMFSRQA